MSTKQLDTRQACLIILISMLSTKLLSLNSIISYDMGNNAWFSFFISFVIDFLFALIFIYLINKIDMPILDYIRKKFGYAVSIIISVFVGIMFLFKTTEIMVDIYLFFVQLIYVEVGRIVFVVCFILVLYYFSTRFLRSIGRTIELLLYLILFSLVLSVMISFKAINYENLLPFLNINVVRTSQNVILHNLWFGDFWFLFFMIGNIKKEKGTNKKLIWSYVLSSLIILVFVVIFTGVFGYTASLHRVCVIDITEVSPRLINQARFAWLVDFIFPIVLIMGLGVHANCTTICIKHFIHNSIKSKNTISGALTTASILAIGIVFRFTFTSFYQFITNGFFYFNTFSQYVLPIIILIMVEIVESKRNRGLGYDKKNAT